MPSAFQGFKVPVKSKEEMHRIPAAFNKETMEWLGRLTREAKFSGGASLRTTQILRALARAGMWLDFDVRGVANEDELFERIKESVIKKRKTNRTRD